MKHPLYTFVTWCAVGFSLALCCIMPKRSKSELSDDGKLMHKLDLELSKLDDYFLGGNKTDVFDILPLEKQQDAIKGTFMKEYRNVWPLGNALLNFKIFCS